MASKILKDHLKEIRIKKGISQEELGERSNLSLRTIQRLEKGEGNPREDTLILLAKALDLPIDYFTNYNQDSSKEPIFSELKKILTIIGFAAGFIIGLIIILSGLTSNDNISTLVILATSFLFGALGYLVGVLLKLGARKEHDGL